MSDLERIEAAMEEKVRPALRSHGGDISIDHVEGKTVYVKLLGQCAGCPSADLTNETIVEAEPTLLPKIQLDIVVSKVPVRSVIETAKKVLYTGHIGDGKIFVYDVENVVKVRTGEEGYDALQDVE